MNQRIRELATEARLRPALLLHHWGSVNALTDSEQDELQQIKNFAELIVRECADFLKDTLDDHFAAEQLVEYFGVEL